MFKKDSEIIQRAAPIINRRSFFLGIRCPFDSKMTVCDNMIKNRYVLITNN